MTPADAPLPQADTADLQEQRTTGIGTGPAEAPEGAAEVPVDAPAADVLEQSQEVGPGQRLLADQADTEVRSGAPEADAVEQAVVVEQDEDEYRG